MKSWNIQKKLWWYKLLKRELSDVLSHKWPKVSEYWLLLLVWLGLSLPKQLHSSVHSAYCYFSLTFQTGNSSRSKKAWTGCGGVASAVRSPPIVAPSSGTTRQSTWSASPSLAKFVTEFSPPRILTLHISVVHTKQQRPEADFDTFWCIHFHF